MVDGKLALPTSTSPARRAPGSSSPLRDEKKILGQRCPTCSKVFVPPRATCEVCFADLKDAWVPLKDTGVVTGFTVIHYAEGYQPVKAPYVLALVKPDGADVPMAQVLADVDPAKVTIGMKVKARFAEKRIGSMLDFCFTPA